MVSRTGQTEKVLEETVKVLAEKYGRGPTSIMFGHSPFHGTPIFAIVSAEVFDAVKARQKTRSHTHPTKHQRGEASAIRLAAVRRLRRRPFGARC